MGGIGKTTLARALFNQISGWFHGSCFIENIREALEKGDSQLVPLQQKIISGLIGQEKHVIHTPNTMPKFIKDALQRKKVLIVLDDVNNCEQLELLIDWLEPLRLGSRIIVTTRNKQVLSCYGESNIYDVEQFRRNEALLLFSRCAFKKDHTLRHDRELLSNMVSSYANGNPLALKTLGFNLRGLSKDAWESVMNDLKMIVNPKIHDVLRISYNGLTDSEKNMFLDIACFLKGEKKDEALKVLEACYENMNYCFESLINKALIKISDTTLQMHDLLQELGQEIVKQESKKNSGICSRLWHEDDVCHVLQHNEGIDVVEVISLNMSRLREEIHLSSEVFVKMVNLRVLKLYWSSGYFREYENIPKVQLPQGLKSLPNELRCLHWDGYPLEKLPEFSPKKLVVLKLRHSNIEQLCEGTKDAFNLKSIDISHSKQLKEFPNLQNSKKLEIIDFQGCEKLLRVPLSTINVTKLCRLNMKGCDYLRSIPGNIYFTSPITLDFSWCTNLLVFPQISGNVKELYLCGTAIKEVPPLIGNLTKLVSLDLSGCTRLQSISTRLCQLKSLESLDFSGCLKLMSIPDFMEEMSLSSLNFSRTAIKELSSSIAHLTRLTNLNVGGCKSLETMPISIWNAYRHASFCAEGSAISQLPFSIVGRESFVELNLAFCNLAEFPEVICHLSALQKLNLRGNNFGTVPESIKQLRSLNWFSVSDCNKLQSIQGLPMELEFLLARNCKQLQSLPAHPPDLVQPDEFGFPSTSCILDFVNCLNLNQNGCGNILQKIEQMATAYHKVNDEIPELNIILPGREIPEWFNFQSQRSFITLELPQHCSNRRLIGFAICAVLTFENDVHLHLSFFSYDSRVDNIIFVNFGVKEQYGHLIESDHIQIGFIPANDLELLEVEGHSVKVLFDFHTSLPKLCKVKCCGINPLYEDPNSDEFKTEVQRMRESDLMLKPKLADVQKRKFLDANTSGSGAGGSDEDEV